METRRSLAGTAILCALCVLAGAIAQVVLTKAHLEADEMLQAACSALAVEAVRLIEAREAMVAPPDAVAVGS